MRTRASSVRAPSRSPRATARSTPCTATRPKASAYACVSAAHGDSPRHTAATERALYEQTSTECGGGVSATATDRDEVQTRSFPGSHHGNTLQKGYEHFDATPLVEAAPRVAEEALALLSAPDCPSGMATLIL